MFTGIVDGFATVFDIKKKKKIHNLTTKLPSTLCKNIKIGDSIAHNGCCLTVKKIENYYIMCDIIEETLKSTNLGFLKIGENVNIERSVKYGDEIGGHIISGHVTNTVEIVKILNSDNNYILWLRLKNKNLKKYIFKKGFICLDGISLTVGNIIEDKFCVNIIPQTLFHTTIRNKKHGSLMNIEIDFYTQTIVDTTERLINEKNINIL
ncbi:riboflavin synthase subunit alpha [Buchnera aphidicola]|uniref:Riboflavin synthase n=1 Tax=Buchnera aphidicola (Lipaphis pseudobrassicae) TaxID=1258543 RepID=A0A4D6Y0A6_9GAMM|nr:riboflavin synthase subunit alpha [Buchnera aphidicola]QCI21999.1 riboflavin synthase subunit alpha [Buchnera aphidicola (Lipaphis pseudobrassicae)]